METTTLKITREDQRIAQASMQQMYETSQYILNTEESSVSIKIQGRKGVYIFPKKAVLLLFDIITNMASGKAVSLMPSDDMVSTQYAADLLHVSRPHIVSLLEKGEIPFQKVGAHRRIKLSDLIIYDKKMKKIQSEKLSFLAKQAQALNMGY